MKGKQKREIMSCEKEEYTQGEIKKRNKRKKKK